MVNKLVNYNAYRPKINIYNKATQAKFDYDEDMVNQFRLNTKREEGFSDTDKRDVRNNYKPELTAWEEYLNQNKSRYDKELADYNAQVKNSAALSYESKDTARYNALLAAGGKEVSKEPPKKSTFMEMYESTQRKYNRENVEITDDGYIKLNEAQIKEQASMNRARSESNSYMSEEDIIAMHKAQGTFDPNMNYKPDVDPEKQRLEDEQKYYESMMKYDEETRNTILALSDKESYMRMEEIKNKIDSDVYKINDTGLDEYALGDDIQKYELQNNPVILNEIADYAASRQLETVDDYFNINTGHSFMDFVLQIGAENSIGFLSTMSSLESGVFDRIGRSHANTKYATDIGQALYSGADEAAKVANSGSFELSEAEKEAVDYAAFQESINRRSYMGYMSDDMSRAVDTSSRDYFGSFLDQIGQQTAQITNPWTALITSLGLVAGGTFGGLTGGGAGAVAGAKKGASVGLTLGNTKAAGEVEAGYAFKEMIDNGIDPEIAHSIAITVGGINAAIETVQFGSLMKWANATGGDQALKYGIKEWTKATAKNVGANVAEELAQETVTMTGYNIAVDRHNLEYNTDLADISFNDAVDRLVDTGLTSMFTFTLMQTPNMIMDAKNIGKLSFNDTQKQQWTDEVGKALESTKNPVETSEIMKAAENLMGAVGINETQAAQINDAWNKKIESFKPQEIAEYQNNEDTKAPSTIIQEERADVKIKREVQNIDLKKIQKTDKDKQNEQAVIKDVARLQSDEYIDMKTEGYNTQARVPRTMEYDKTKIPQAIDEFKNTQIKDNTFVINNDEILQHVEDAKYDLRTKQALTTGKLLADAFGIDIIYHDGKIPAKDKNGNRPAYSRTEAMINSGFVSININDLKERTYKVPVDNIVAHELFHIVNSKHPKIGEELMSIVANDVSKKDIAIFQALYEGNEADIDVRMQAATVEELTADLFSKIVSGEGNLVLQKLSQKNKKFTDAFIRVLKEINTKIKQLASKFTGRTSHIVNEKEVLNTLSKKISRSISTLTSDSKLTTDNLKKVNKTFETVHKNRNKVKKDVTPDETKTNSVIGNVPRLTRHNYRKELGKAFDDTISRIKHGTLSPEFAVLQLQQLANDYINSDIYIEVLNSVADATIDIHEVALAYRVKTDDKFKEMFVSMGLSGEEIKMIMAEKAAMRKEQQAREKEAEAKRKADEYQKLSKEEKNKIWADMYDKAKKEGRITKIDKNNKVVQQGKNKIKENLKEVFDEVPEKVRISTQRNKSGTTKIVKYDSNPKKTKRLENEINRKQKELSYKNQRIENEKAKVKKLRVKIATLEKSQAKSKINNMKKTISTASKNIKEEQLKIRKLERENLKLEKQYATTKHMIGVEQTLIHDDDLRIESGDIKQRRFTTDLQNTILQEANNITESTDRLRHKQTTELVLQKAKEIKRKYTDDQISTHLLNLRRALSPVEQALLYDQLTEARNANDITKSQLMFNRLVQSSSDAGLSLWFNREVKQMLPDFMIERTVDKIVGRVEDLKKSNNKQLALWAKNFDFNDPKAKAILDNVRLYAEAVGKIDKDNKTAAIKAEKIMSEMKKKIDLFIPTDFKDTTVSAKKTSGMLTFGIAKLGRDITSNALNMASQSYEAAWSGLIGTKIASKITKTDIDSYYINPAKMYIEYGLSIMSGIKGVPSIISQLAKQTKEAKKIGGKRYAAKTAHLNIAELSNSLANIIDISSEAAFRKSLKSQGLKQNEIDGLIQHYYDNTVMNLRGGLYRNVLKVREALNEASENATGGRIHLGNWFLPVLKFASNIVIPLANRNPITVMWYDAKTITKVQALKKAMNDPNISTEMLNEMKTEVSVMIERAVGRTGVTMTLTILAAMLASAMKSDDEEKEKIAATINNIITSRWFESVDMISLNTTTDLLATDTDGTAEFIQNVVGKYGSMFIENTVFNTFLYPTKYSTGYEESAIGYATNVASTALTSQIPTFVSEISDLFATITDEPTKDVYGGNNMFEDIWYRLLDRTGVGNFYGIPLKTSKYGDIANNTLNAELEELHTKVETNMFVKPAKSFSLDGDKYEFDVDVYDEFTVILGEKNGDDFMELMKSKEYDTMTDGEKIEALKEINSSNIRDARSQIIEENKIKPVK